MPGNRREQLRLNKRTSLLFIVLANLLGLIVES